MCCPKMREDAILLSLMGTDLNFISGLDVTGVVNLQEGVEMIMPGDNTEMEIKLISPIAMEEGQRFAIREGGRTIGAGSVTRIIE